MTGKKATKLFHTYQPHNHIYSVGPWYVLVNVVTRKCQITSGDIWYDIPRDEAANWLRYGQPSAVKAA